MKLCELGEVKFEDVFQDGTKIEANANRYTFVRKKAIEKNEAKMLLKVVGLAEEIRKLYFKEFTVTKETVNEEMESMVTFLEQKKIEEKIEFDRADVRKEVIELFLSEDPRNWNR